MSNVDLYLTPKELAELIGITVPGLRKLIKENNIPVDKQNPRIHKIYPTSVRKIYELRNIDIPKAVISAHIVKGGVGKTTIIHGLASRAAAMGFNVLMIDLDQQANLTTSFNVKARVNQDLTIYELIAENASGSIKIEDVITPITGNLDIIPSNLKVAFLERYFSQHPENYATFFQNLLAPVRNDYDLIFCDCPPALSMYVAAVHCFSDKIIVPVNMDLFSMEGLKITIDHMHDIFEKFKHHPDIHIMINKMDLRHKHLMYAFIERLNLEYKEYLLSNYVSVTKNIDNCIAKSENIWNLPISKTPALQDLHSLLQEILNFGQGRHDTVEASAVIN